MVHKYFDYNSLQILNAVIECRSVTDAAKKMNISPSSVTYAINKIRKITSDPIFNRSKSGIIPTTLAIELNARYIKAMLLINDGLFHSMDSQKTEFHKTITIGTYSWLEFCLSSYYLKDNDNESLSTVSLNFKRLPTTALERIEQLSKNEVDIEIGGPLPRESTIISEELFSSGYTALVSSSHSTIRDQLTLDDWRNTRLIKWGSMYDETVVESEDVELINELKSVTLNVSCETSLNSLLICALSDYIMVIPAYMAEFIKVLLPVRSFDLPFKTSMKSTIFAHYLKTQRKNSNVMTLITEIRRMESLLPRMKNCALFKPDALLSKHYRFK